MKPLYLLRTLPPNVTILLGERFEELKKCVLKSILSCGTEELTELHYLLFNLPLVDGDIGIHLMKEMAPCAYMASILEFDKSHGGIVLESVRNGLNDAFVQSVNSVISGFTVDGATLEETILGLRSYEFSKEMGTVQGQLLSRIESKRKIVLEARLAQENPAHLTWWKSHQNDEAGKWLQVMPMCAKLCLSNKQYCRSSSSSS